MSDRHAAPEADVTGWDAVDTDEIERRVAAPVDGHVDRLKERAHGASQQVVGPAPDPRGRPMDDGNDDDLRAGLDETSERIREAVMQELPAGPEGMADHGLTRVGDPTGPNGQAAR